MANTFNTPDRISDVPLVLIKNMINLATSGFGVVVALAWNEVIQNAVKTYIDPYLGKNSGMVSLLIYAIVITALAVIVTMQLTSIEKQLSTLNKAVAERAKMFSRSRQMTEAGPKKKVRKQSR